MYHTKNAIFFVNMVRPFHYKTFCYSYGILAAACIVMKLDRQLDYAYIAKNIAMILSVPSF